MMPGRTLGRRGEGVGHRTGCLGSGPEVAGEREGWAVSICPNCGAAALPSQATFVLTSTSGPVVHQTWRCAAGCWWQTYVVQPDSRVAETNAVEAAQRALSRFRALRPARGDDPDG